MDPLSVKRRLSCILAADAVGYSQQMEQDEESTIRVLAAHRAVIDGIVTFHGGRIISTAGDSVMAEFSSVVEAVRCAVEIQEALKTRNDALPDKSQMHFRVGVNLGDVVVRNDDLLGDGVNVAARLETLADPGGICISSSVYDQITGKLDLGFQDIGEQTLKNISRPIHVYRVSGTGAPQRTALPVAARPRAHGALPWAIGAAVVAIAALAAWQLGWVSFGVPGRTPSGASAPVTANASSTAASPQRADSQAAADSAALRAEAQAELARARAESEAARATRAQADAEAAANRVRTQALADAARIRADAEASAARTRDAAAPAPAAAPVVTTAAPRSAASGAGENVVATNASIAAAKTAAPSAGDTRFDGAWDVIVNCEPMGRGALGYKFDFVAQVKDNFLRGERRAEGSPGWLKLQGPIQPDGSATLDAQGLTDNPKYSNGVAHGTPYAYHVAARFDSDRGSGRRLEMRACDLHFAKQ